MGELFKREDTIDELLESMGVQIVLDGNTLSEKDKEEIKKNGDIITLTAKELALFSILYRNRGRIVTTDILCEELWPDGSLYKFILFDCNHSINCYKHRIQNEVIRL